MAITYTPFKELFAPEYQLTYISVGGYIDVGPNTYSVFYDYTMTERQVIFQVCEKWLPWGDTQEQEQWERTQYMYQFVVKPYPFPYSEYPLSKDITTTEFLIYNKEHWMDALTSEQVAEYVKKYSNFQVKYDSRYQRGDIVEVRPDGFYTSTLKGDLSKWAFRVVVVEGLKADKMYMEGTVTKRRRYSIPDGATKIVHTVSKIEDITIIDKAQLQIKYNG